jgi:hypothetical protein
MVLGAKDAHLHVNVSIRMLEHGYFAIRSCLRDGNPGNPCLSDD